MSYPAKKSRQLRILLLGFFTILITLLTGFFSFSAYVFFNEASSGYPYYLRSDMIFYGHSGLQLGNSGLMGGAGHEAFYYIFPVIVFVSFAVIGLMFIYFYRLILKTEGAETALKNVEKNILEIPSTIIHEIKGNINALAINSRVLAERARRNQDISKISGIVESETVRLSETMENILRFSKDYSLNMERTSLNGLISSAVEKSIPRASQKGVNIAFSPVDSEIFIRMEGSLMEQVFVNLISNAVESYEGAQTRDSKAKVVMVYSSFYIDKVIINIEDYGKGMSRETLQKIYEPFFTTRNNGTGLGLPLVKKILGAHGFKIEIKSSEGSGTRVSVLLKTLEN